MPSKLPTTAALMKWLRIGFGAAGVAAGAFGIWGLFTEAGNRRFDEMDGMIPYYFLVGIVPLCAIAVALIRPLTDFQRANRAKVVKNYERAIKLYVRHAKKHPADAARAYVGAAECCLHSNILSSPIAVAPGVELVSEGDRNGAQRYFHLALEADSKNPRALWGLAALLPDESAERRRLLETLVAVQPDTLCLVALGDYYRSHVGDNERAYKLYKQAQEHSPRDQTAYLRLADVCRQMARPGEAAEWEKRWQQADERRRRRGGE